MSDYWKHWANVPCPRCNAGVGERCRTVSGLIADMTHSPRHTASNKARAFAKEEAR